MTHQKVVKYISPISKNLSPDDVFSADQLSDWAYSNDFGREGV